MELTPLQKAFRAYSAVIEMTAVIVGGVFLGAYIDKRLGTSPLMLMIFILASFGLGVIHLVRVVSSLSQENGKSKKNPR